MSHKKLALDCQLSEIHKLEKFVEEICNEYNIYNSYYGSINTSMASVYEYLCHFKDIHQLIIEFNNYQKGLQFSIYSEKDIFSEIEKLLEDEDRILQSPDLSWLFLLKKVSDKVYIKDHALVLEFEIASINKELDSYRKEKLTLYFKGVQSKSHIDS